MSKMSIKERNKAIRLAWEREQQLVQEGKGTRDWTEEQQKDILDPDKGKAYDENGRAFEGQHMKSAAEYPEYQADPDNIQFLTREEHLEAHKGSWQNPTNWYYNPETKEYIDFGKNEYVPCAIIDLTDPVIRVAETVQASPETTGFSQKVYKNTGNEQGGDIPSLIDSISPVPYEANVSPKHSKKFIERIKGGIMDAVKAGKRFSVKHPVLTSILKTAVVAVGTAGFEALVNRGKGSGGDLSSSTSDDYYSSSSDNDRDDSFDTDFYDDVPSSRDYPDERSSPEEHTVQAHGQHYHTKNGVTWKEIEPYQRGGKHKDD